MRRLAILAIFLGCPGAALAASGPAADPTLATLNGAAFAPNASRASSDPIDSILDRPAYAPGDLPYTRRADTDPRAQQYPSLYKLPGISFGAGDVNVDVSPHAGVTSSGGGSAEAGAMVQLSRADAASARLNALGVKDGAKFGDEGRWYLFAAASGRAVGMNMLHGDSGWGGAGWSTDPTSKLVGDAQVGVGWRRGAIQTSVGYVHRKVKGDHLMYGVDPHDDSMVAFSLSIRPRK
jgi:hypothetical protein